MPMKYEAFPFWLVVTGVRLKIRLSFMACFLKNSQGHDRTVFICGPFYSMYNEDLCFCLIELTLTNANPECFFFIPLIHGHLPKSVWITIKSEMQVNPSVDR